MADSYLFGLNTLQKSLKEGRSPSVWYFDDWYDGDFGGRIWEIFKVHR